MKSLYFWPHTEGKRMENFIVSARKYRPATFDTVIGQASITTTLKNAIRNNQLAQAFLFCGPRGVGKTTCARILAKTINCDNPTETTEACNVCPSCVSFNESSSFNIHELDAASNNSVDGIRNLIDQVRIPPQSGRYKVYIIDEVHMLSNAAFNSFLKTLEEPPPYAKFILATTDKHKIIPTILSRCQIFDFKRIGIDDIAKHLTFVAKSEHVEAEEQALHIIAQKADGALRDALSIFDQIVSFGGNELTYSKVIENLNVLDYDYYFVITNSMLAGNLSQTLVTINEILNNGFDGQHFLIGLGEHLRNLLMCKDKVTSQLIETSGNIRLKYTEQAKHCSVPFLLKALDLSNKCDLNYRISNNKRLLVELALMQMCEIQEASFETDKNKLTLNTPKSQPSLERSEPVYATEQTPEKPENLTKTGQSPDKTEPLSVTIQTPAKPEITKTEPTQPKSPNYQSRPSQISQPTTNLSIKGAGIYSNDKSDNNISGSMLVNEPANTPFSFNDLLTAWTDFANQFITVSPNFYSTLTRRMPELKPDNIISLIIDNKVQEDELNNKRSDMLQFLSQKLQNDLIRFETSLSASDEARRPYTDQDKFAALSAKNPSLLLLKKEIDLELDL
jgi:DNA polymerase III subunit gamma/tau